ncbi:hypothetical protein [Shinella zoogloeoides]|uniref:hypothetical protein n=1 Tax=Shinella zoogloeoides TaxID=352475 RepID=UPI00299EB825|nr:hypothetical protein [Shinella zoogloeoides]
MAAIVISMSAAFFVRRSMDRQNQKIIKRHILAVMDILVASILAIFLGKHPRKTLMIDISTALTHEAREIPELS